MPWIILRNSQEENSDAMNNYYYEKYESMKSMKSLNISNKDPIEKFECHEYL